MMTKKESDGEHPASHYLVAEDPDAPSTWHLRVRDAHGQLDHRLMGAAWAALDGGFRGRRYEGPQKDEAIRKLEALYRSEGLTRPDEKASVVPGPSSVATDHGLRTTDGLPRFIARLEEVVGDESQNHLARIPLAVTGTWMRGARQFSITRDDLEAIGRNFSARRNGEINVDYDHASEMPEVAAGGPVPSAGRIVSMDEPERARGSGSGVREFEPIPNPESRFLLYGWYEPTERARELIRRREYRYISPAIDWGARSKRSGKPQGATLTSVALTNRPFLEELPEIRLSDPAYRLIDVNDVHVETSLPDEPDDRRRDSGFGGRDSGEASLENPESQIQDSRFKIPDSRFKIQDARPDSRFQIQDPRSPSGGFMKKVKLSVLPASASTPRGEAGAGAKVKVSHPDFADDYFAEPEDMQSALSELGYSVGPAVSVNPAPEDVTLSQAAAFCSEAQARGKAVPAAEFFRARVEQALEEAARAGKILPRQRDDWRRIALADLPAFTRLMSEQKARVPVEPLGLSGGVPGDVPTQVRFLAEQRMRERGVTFGQALSEIGREQPGLVREYRRAVSGGE